MKKTAKTIVRWLRLKMKRVLESGAIRRQIEKNNQTLRTLQSKEHWNVSFFLIHSSVWKYHYLYQLFEDSPLFTPTVVICPYTTYGEEIRDAEIQASVELCQSRNYRFINSLLDECPTPHDIIFYTNPHRLTSKEFCIENCAESLGCYAPYSFHVTSLNHLQYDQLFHNLLWRAYYETPVHQQLAQKHSRIEGANVVVSFYPGTDVFLDKGYTPQSAWVLQSHRKKRIIWAPHHTLGEDESGLGYSTFLNLADSILALCIQKEQEIQIAFKPHPLLKAKLYKDKTWGYERTNSYYRKWNDLRNGQVEEGEYIDLFLTSDAMLLDSASFIAEYLYTGKPSCFLLRNDAVHGRFNVFGKDVLNCLYQARDSKEIEEFIDNVVISGSDPLESKRDNFLNKYLIPTNGKMASKIIFDEIVCSLRDNESA